MPSSRQSPQDGFEHSLDDSSTGAEVAHKASYGYVEVVNVVVYGVAFNGGATFEIRDGTGNAIWTLTIPDLTAIGRPMAFAVPLRTLFETDIRTFITQDQGAMTVSYV